MKILICAWDAYMEEDTISTLQEMGINTVIAGYFFEDKNKDDYFIRNFKK
jgi:hypothetical protein